MTFPKNFWPRIVGDRLGSSTTPLRFRNRILETGLSGREWHRALQKMTQPLISKGNDFWSQPLVRRLNFRVVDPRLGDRSVLVD